MLCNTRSDRIHWRRVTSVISCRYYVDRYHGGGGMQRAGHLSSTRCILRSVHTPQVEGQRGWSSTWGVWTEPLQRCWPSTWGGWTERYNDVGPPPGVYGQNVLFPHLGRGMDRTYCFFILVREVGEGVPLMLESWCCCRGFVVGRGCCRGLLSGGCRCRAV